MGMVRTFLYDAVAVGALMAVACSAHALTPATPRMAGQHYTVNLDFHAKRTVVVIPLHTAKGIMAYRLVCATAGPTVTVTAKSGGLLCGLADPGGDLGPALLSGDDATLSARGVFNPEDLVGACAGVPDYGKSRDFRLRGFRLTMKIINVQTLPGYRGSSAWRQTFDFTSDDRSAYPIVAARLAVTLTPDPLAKGLTAEDSPNPRPEACKGS